MKILKRANEVNAASISSPNKLDFDGFNGGIRIYQYPMATRDYEDSIEFSIFSGGSTQSFLKKVNYDVEEVKKLDKNSKEYKDGLEKREKELDKDLDKVSKVLKKCMDDFEKQVISEMKKLGYRVKK